MYVYVHNTVFSCWLYYSLHGVCLYACLFMDACEPEYIILSLYIRTYVYAHIHVVTSCILVILGCSVMMLHEGAWQSTYVQYVVTWLFLFAHTLLNSANHCTYVRTYIVAALDISGSLYLCVCVCMSFSLCVCVSVHVCFQINVVRGFIFLCRISISESLKQTLFDSLPTDPKLLQTGRYARQPPPNVEVLLCIH